MAKEAVFTMKLEQELHASFMAEAEASHRPASQIVRELMREYILQQQKLREYDGFLAEKVRLARASMRAGQGRSNEDVEMDFIARRNKALES